MVATRAARRQVQRCRRLRLYSLGATVWHLLVGRSPFSIPGGDNSTRALSARILHAAPPATQRTDLPPALDRLLQQCLSKQAAHRPRSALELARSLQRIESAAGWPRTAVAVEGDRPDESVAVRPPEESPGDATAMRPVTVISASGPRRLTPGEDARDSRGQQEGRRQRAGGDEDRQPSAGTTTSATPSDLVPDVLTRPPSVDGERTSGGVVFRWRIDESLRPGDQWIYQVDGQPGFRRTSRRRAVIDQPGDVCLTVRLARDGDESPTGHDCVP